MRRDARSNDAVSPVVGVMLMLVVTIIIAAVVSAFAGGVAGSEKRLPTATLTGTYSQANGLTITHAGGDMVAISGVNFMTTPSEIMGPDAAKFAWIINKTIIIDPQNSNTAIYNQTSGVYGTTMFKPGDTLVVSHDNCVDYNTTSKIMPDPGVNKNAQVFWTGDGKSTYFGTYAFGNPSNVGKYFYLDLVNSAGSMIARAEVTITK